MLLNAMALLKLASAVLVFQLTFIEAIRVEPEYLKSFKVDVEFTKPPDFCHGLECPKFSVINKTKNYEERLYDESGWVSTHMDGISYNVASEMMFMELFGYIQGKNAKGQHIAMTAPVTVSVIPGPGPACKSNFTMSFFLSPSLKPAPQPSNKAVFLTSLPKQRVFVRSFGGFASESTWLDNAEALAKALVKDSKGFKKGSFFTAGYDSPFSILHRHNEVWYVAE